MEALTRLVSESLARHGFDRPLDYRRLHWSRWFRCESLHSLLFVPSKPGVFAIAEEIMDLPERSSADVEERRFSAASGPIQGTAALAAAPARIPEAESRNPETGSRRMLAVTQFFEADDMAFVLDRMLSRPNPMRDRLASGRYFVRFVLIEDPSQRRTISSALNQWMVSAAEKATGIGTYFATSFELNTDDVARAPSHAKADVIPIAGGPAATPLPAAAPCGEGTLARDSAATNIHGPAPFPSGF